MRIQKLVTHSGKFHIDEVMSTMILRVLYPEAELIRTRDQDMFENARGQAIIYDVGYAYNPQMGIFDHHQNPGPLREDGTPYSSFGLIWKHYGHAFLDAIECDQADIDEVWTTFDRQIVTPVDKIDNGVISPSDMGEASGLSLAMLINDLNPPYYAQTAENENDLFQEALEIAVTAVMSRLEHISAELTAQKAVANTIEEQWGSPLLFLEECLPYEEAIFKSEASHIKYVVHPRSDGDWVLSGVPLVAGEYTLREDLPKDWAGLEGGALQRATGAKGAVFCHAKRFMAVASTCEDILVMARGALQELEVSGPV